MYRDAGGWDAVRVAGVSPRHVLGGDGAGKGGARLGAAVSVRNKFGREQCVRVEAYAGYRDGERPRAFHLGGGRIEVERLEERWAEEDKWGTRRRCFRVRGNDGRGYLLLYDEAAGSWYVRQ